MSTYRVIVRDFARDVVESIDLDVATAAKALQSAKVAKLIEEPYDERSPITVSVEFVPEEVERPGVAEDPVELPEDAPVVPGEEPPPEDDDAPSDGW